MIRRVSVILLVFMMFTVSPAHTECRTYDAVDGARCDVRMWPGEPGGKFQWESRVLLKDDRIRLINRRARGEMDPGPEELLWTGRGIIAFMGGRASPFEPGSVLTVAEAYLLAEMFGSMWKEEDGTAVPGGISLSSPFGTGILRCDDTGFPAALVISDLGRSLWDGSRDITVRFIGSTKEYPWEQARIEDSSQELIATFERVRFKTQSLSDDMFSVEDEKGLRLADLSSPVDRLLGSEDGEYTETAGAQGLRDLSGTAYAGGDAYMGYVPAAEEVDAFMRGGALGRYGDGN